MVTPIEEVENTSVRNGEIELCAVFATDTTKEDERYARMQGKWYVYGMGLGCDTETIRVQPGTLYKW